MLRARGAWQGLLPTAASCPAGRVRAHLLGLRRSGDHRGDGGLRREPADRHARAAHAALLRERLEASTRSRLARPPISRPVQPRALRRRLAAAVLAGEQAAREREVRDDRRARAARRPAPPRPRLALEQAVLVLDGDEAACRSRGDASASRPCSAREVRAADGAHLALVDQLARARRASPRSASPRRGGGTGRGRSGRSAAAAATPRPPSGCTRASRGTSAPSPPSSVPNFVASTTRSRRPCERPAEQLLAAAAVAVDVRGVEERDARVERGVDDRARRLLVDPPAEVVAAEPDDGHLKIRELPSRRVRIARD